MDYHDKIHHEGKWFVKNMPIMKQLMHFIPKNQPSMYKSLFFHQAYEDSNLFFGKPHGASQNIPDPSDSEKTKNIS